MNERQQRIEAIALANQFKRKPQPNGQDALNPYVFDFAEALISEFSRESYGDGYYDGFIAGGAYQHEHDCSPAELTDVALSHSEAAEHERSPQPARANAVLKQFQAAVREIGKQYRPEQFATAQDWLAFCLSEATLSLSMNTPKDPA